MKMLAMALVLLVAAGSAADFLVRVDLAPGPGTRMVADLGADVLAGFDGWCLVRGDAAAVARLRAGFDCTVLDSNPGTGRYVYAETDPGFNRRRLAGFGSVLAEDRTGVLLRTTEDGIKGMNRLPVELCGISTVPLRSSPAPDPRPQTRFPVSDSLVWALMARACQDSVEATLRRLIAFRTRYAYTESCWSAARWFQAKLAAYGCDTTYLDTFEAALGPNVVGVKRGQVNPNQVYIICGHVDNTSGTPYDYAPGSDDNGSGAGLVLEAARMFAGVDFEYTVWFIGFGGEEQGLVGSDSFARHSRERGDTLVLTINHDMDSYGTAGRDSIRVVGKRSNPPCSTWVEFYMAQADTFTDLKCRREIVDDQASSDQHSFWDYGYAAIRDRYLDRDPVYHTTGDTVGPFEYVQCGTNNIPMYTEAIKATVATIAKLAGANQRVGVAEGKLTAHSLQLTACPTVFRNSVRIRLDPSNPRTLEPLVVSVYDASGRLVRVLSSPRPPTPDPYSLSWDGSTDAGGRAGPGVYLFRLSGSDGTATARAILVE